MGYINCLLAVLLLGGQALAAADNSPQDSAEPDKILYWYRNYDNQSSYQLLDLALKKTADLYGDYSIVRSQEVTQGRAVVELQNGRVDTVRLINVVPEPDRLKNLIPVKIASEAGMIGLRVCIINKADAGLFEGIRVNKDLIEQGVVFGQSVHWPDSRILTANSLPVVTSASYESLYPMLKNRRFNCFLRSLIEVVGELEKYGDDSLMIEPNLLFSYPSVLLFFVSKADQALAIRLELGLRRAILDGSFTENFKKNHAENLAQLNVAGRRVIRLNNPLLDNELLKNLSNQHIMTDGKLNIY
jgi:hypothetical protein